MSRLSRFSAVVATATAAVLLCAAPRRVEAAGAAATPARPPVAVTIATSFPHFDWTRRVVGDSGRVQVVLLQDKGVDVHSYRPTAADLKAVGRCDLFIFVGGESDGWTDKALTSSRNRPRKTLRLLDALGGAAREEQSLEGMEAPGVGLEEEGAIDEHVWLSPRVAASLIDPIAAALAEIDPQGAGDYRRNAAAYRRELEALDRDYAAAVSNAPRRTLIVADRYPFRYLAADYGLDAFAAFPGCSAESEASFKTILFLARKVDETQARAIAIVDESARRVAETVRKATARKDQKIVRIDPLQSATAEEVDRGKTYLGTMRRNLESLAEALQ